MVFVAVAGQLAAPIVASARIKISWAWRAPAGAAGCGRKSSASVRRRGRAWPRCGA